MQREIGNRADCYLLFQSDTPVDYPVFRVTSADLIDLGYRNLTLPLQAGFKQLPVFVFHRKQSYDYYWFVEYDVRFTGNWELLLTSFETNPVDFLAAHVRTDVQEPEWCWWPSLQHPTQVHRNKLRCLAVVFRISRAAMGCLDDAYVSGWIGHPEVLWPTILYHAGYTIEDFGGEGAFTPAGRVARWYCDSSPNSKGQLYDGTLRFRNPMRVAGTLTDKLYHPVKTADHQEQV
jgi:hypothetical protein